VVKILHSLLFAICSLLFAQKQGRRPQSQRPICSLLFALYYLLFPLCYLLIALCSLLKSKGAALKASALFALC